MTTIKCETCCKEFIVIDSRAKKARFCSRECIVDPRKSNIVEGEKINRLTIIKEVEGRIKKDKNGFSIDRMVECLCECGKIIITRYSAVKRGAAKSCGCLTLEKAKINIDRTTHGLSKHPLYLAFYNMKSRCYDETDEAYPRYGGRGIGVCRKWLNDFKLFYDWAMSHGWVDGLEIDRYPNNDGNYCPSNCRVTTMRNNMNNTSKTIYVYLNRKKTPLSFACEELGVDRKLIWQRMKRDNMTFMESVNYKRKTA